jgi:hypothetical protein
MKINQQLTLLKINQLLSIFFQTWIAVALLRHPRGMKINQQLTLFKINQLLSILFQTWIAVALLRHPRGMKINQQPIGRIAPSCF